MDRPAGVNAIPLGSENLVLVSSPDRTPSRGRRAVPLDTLADTTFVDFPTGWGVRTVVDRAFAASGLRRRVTMEIADVATCLQLIRAGLGIAIIPPSLVPPGDIGLVQRPISPPITWHVVMATPASATNAAAHLLAELVTSATSRLGPVSQRPQRECLIPDPKRGGDGEEKGQEKEGERGPDAARREVRRS